MGPIPGYDIGDELSNISIIIEETEILDHSDDEEEEK